LPDNPPPGVPALRTPVPGSIRSPVPPTVPVARAADSAPPYPPPVPGAPGSYPPPHAAPGPYPSPPPYAGYPSPPPQAYPAPGYPSPPPGPHTPPQPYSYPAPAGYPSPPRFPTAQPAPRRGLALVAIGALAAVGAAAVVFFAMRGDESPPSPAPPSPSPAPAPAPGPTKTTVVPDFSIKPDRQLYGDDPQDDDPTHAAPPPGHGQPGNGVWDGGWWKDSSGALEVDIPRGFSIGAGSVGGAALFAGDCDGTPCTVQVITSPIYGIEVDEGMIAQVVSQMPAAMGQAGTVSHVRVQGVDRHSLVVDNATEGMRGQLVIFHGGGVLALVLVQAPQAGFDDTAAFRKQFFENRVRMRDSR
jgi:hypothetical protein